MDDLISTMKAVSVLDPAIDLDVTPLDVYRVTRSEGIVALVPGRHARWASIRALTVGEFAACDSMPSNPTKLLNAFRVTCQGVENFEAPGVMLTPTKRYKKADGREGVMWADDELGRLMGALGFAFIYEMGQLAYDRAISGNGWSGSVAYTLPQFLEPALDLRQRQHAALKAATAGTRSSEQSATS